MHMGRERETQVEVITDAYARRDRACIGTTFGNELVLLFTFVIIS
jgi:hypothetical protein